MNPTRAQGNLLTPPLTEHVTNHNSGMLLGVGAVQGTTLHLCATNLKLFHVALSCMAFTAYCKCPSIVSRNWPQKKCQVVDKECSEDVPGNLKWQLVDL